MKTILPKFIDAYGDSRGLIYVIENIKEFIPFDVMRFYFITDITKSSVRGGHGHKNLKQFFLLIKGNVELIIKEINSTNKTKIIFDTPGQYFYLKEGFFRDIHFTEGSIFVVFASDIYKEEDYF